MTTTVAKEHVHRTSLADVFLTGCASGGPDTFTITAQWPRVHSFYRNDHGLYDPLMLCETIRQSLPFLMHTRYDVPIGHQLMWQRFRYSVDSRAMVIGRTPAELTLRVTCRNATYRRGLPASLDLRYEVLRENRLLAVAGTTFTCHTPAVYRRLRGERADMTAAFWDIPRPPAPLPPHECGSERERDVVLSPTERSGRWELRSDIAHPILFDHPVDHVPGMLLLEAARQAAYATRPPGGAGWPASMDVSFLRYVEFGRPCQVLAEPHDADGPAQTGGDGSRTLRVSAVQDGAPAFEALLDVLDHPITP
ncbi:ScbA/BarX family gamma-butyrolactone biosynthesis protein (plasmid) [Streptomyces sp. BI20]|uniref:ScbA/BarX family gamma-butyrolactone biosynthesis protein n=1 Tax=Streptomyces sp. BI20 TaxID=3403460 RepID=UPI003C73CD68